MPYLATSNLKGQQQLEPRFLHPGIDAFLLKLLSLSNPQVACLGAGGPSAAGRTASLSLRTIASAPRYRQWVLDAALLPLPTAPAAPGLTRRGLVMKVSWSYSLTTQSISGTRSAKPHR